MYGTFATYRFEHTLSYMRNAFTRFMSKCKVLIGGLDTETDHEPDGSNARIVQWAIVIQRQRSNERRNVDKTKFIDSKGYQEFHGYTLDELRDRFYALMGNVSTKYVIYVHNLNYDFQFMRGMIADIIDGFDLIDEPEEDYDPFGDFEGLVFGSSPNHHKECFMLAPENRPAIIRFGNIELRDSSKKLPAGTTVKEMGDMIGYPKLESPRGDFHPGWSADLTDDDFQYVIRDAEIVARLMSQFHKEGAVRATISSDAMGSAKAIFNKSHNINGYGQWDKYFPTLSYEVDRLLRAGYMGGINVSQHIGLNKGPIVALDVNSMYPTVMKYDLLPYGLPIETDDPVRDGFELYVVKARMRFHLKPGMIPVFKFKTKEDADLEGLGTSDPVRDCSAWHNMTLTNVDLENYGRFYDIEIDRNTAKYWAFKCAVGHMGEYIDYWYDVKAKAPKNSVQRSLAKLHLNSLYGKFGFNPDVTIAYFAYDADLDDIALKGWPDVADNAQYYLPYAMFVTAQARNRLCSCILRVGCANVIHCDTDSVKCFGTPDMFADIIDDKELGKWKVEDMPEYLIEGGVKRYLELMAYPIRSMDDILAVSCAGMPQKKKDGVPIGMWVELLDEPMLICDTGYVFGRPSYRIKSQWLRDLYESHGMDPDHVNTMKLQQKKVKGGALLVETTFTLNDSIRHR